MDYQVSVGALTIIPTIEISKVEDS